MSYISILMNRQNSLLLVYKTRLNFSKTRITRKHVKHSEVE